MHALIRLIQKTYRMVDPSEGKRVMHNVLSLSGLQAITYILPIIILPYLFRTLGPERFGLIAFAQAFVQYFMILTDYGFSVSATKEISLCQDEPARINKVFSAVMTIKTCLALLSLGILWGIVHLIPKFSDEPLIYILSFGAVIGNTLFPTWFFQGTETMKHIAKLNIFGEFIYALCIFIFVRSPLDYLQVPLITSSVAVMTGLLGQYIVFRKFGVSFTFPSFNEIRHQLMAGWNIFISVMAINAYTNTRVFAVGLLTNNSITGFYSIAEKIANAVQTFPLSAFSQAIFPRLSKIFHKSPAKAFEIMGEIQKITVIVSLICLPVIFLCAPNIIQLVCGASYPRAAFCLQLLLVSVFFISANAFRVQFLLVAGHTDTYSRIHITMAALGLPLILALIFMFSYAGAAMATVAIEAGSFILTWLAVRKLKPAFIP